MLSRTPDPTPQQVLENLKYCSLRAGLVQEEIVSRLQKSLPGAIDLWNTTEGRTDLAQVKQPKDYAPAPIALGDGYANTVLVSIAVQTSGLAARLMQQEAEVVIYSIGDKWSPGDRHIMRRVFERAELIQGVMHPFLTCCINENGINLWRELVPRGQMAMPEGFGDQYAGVSISYLLRATPKANARPST